MIGRASSRHRTPPTAPQRLLRFPDGEEVETAHIPKATGARSAYGPGWLYPDLPLLPYRTQRLVRNLSSAEIIGQLLLARDAFGEWPTPSDTTRHISNIVLMGMGEPLYNYANVKRAMQIAMDGEGIGISKRRITLSTSGVVPEIARCGTELGVNLAVACTQWTMTCVTRLCQSTKSIRRSTA